jgi:hypothetical protein
LVHSVRPQAVFRAGKPCTFETMSVLWIQRSFGAVHWASESPNRCLVGTPSLKTQLTLFHSALCRTACSSPCGSSLTPDAWELDTAEAQPPQTDSELLPEAEAPAPVSILAPRRTPTCDLSSHNLHPLIPAVRRRNWLEGAAEARRKRAAEQQEKGIQGTV